MYKFQCLGPIITHNKIQMDTTTVKEISNTESRWWCQDDVITQTHFFKAQTCVFENIKCQCSE